MSSKGMGYTGDTRPPEKLVADIVKRIVCLANSRKYQERCIAGRELLQGGRPGQWVRPVSAREFEGVSLSERSLGDAGEPRLLDVIDVPVIEARSRSYQSENWLLDPDRAWKLVGRFGPARLSRIVESAAPLWIDSYSSSEGKNDRIPTVETEGLDSSLCLIRVERAELSVTGYEDRRRLRVLFSHAGSEYALRLTDPQYEERYSDREAGTYSIGESYMTISLGEPFNDYAYKLIAALIETAEIRSTR